MSDELDDLEAQVERARQVAVMASFLEKHPMPKPARKLIAECMYDGGARVPVAAPVEAAEPVVQVPEPVESPMRARLRAENPDLVAKIEAAEAARKRGDVTEHLNLLAEIRPRALAELQAALKAAAEKGC